MYIRLTVSPHTDVSFSYSNRFFVNVTVKYFITKLIHTYNLFEEFKETSLSCNIFCLEEKENTHQMIPS